MKLSRLVDELCEFSFGAHAWVEVGPDGVGLGVWQDGERVGFIEMPDDEEGEEDDE